MGLYLLNFNLGHQLLARQYNMLSYEIPMILEDKEIDEATLKKRQVRGWILICLNILLPLAMPVALINYYLKYFVT